MPPGTIPQVIGQRYDPAIPLNQLTEHPMNPNAGDEGIVCQSLDAHGFYGAVLVQESTGIVFAGNTRLRAARDKGMMTVPGFWCDVDGDTAARILLMDNESTRRGANDEATLVTLLQGLAATPRGLEGTAYDGDQLDDMIRFLAPPALDDLGGNDDPSAAWPSVTIRAPHHVVAAWNDHAKAYDGDGAAAFAQLLGLELEP